MPRKPTTPREIALLRRRMDRLNLRLAAQIQERARLARTIGRAKAKLGLAAADPGREREMLAAILRTAAPPIPRAELATIWRAIFKASRSAVLRDRRRRR